MEKTVEKPQEPQMELETKNTTDRTRDLPGSSARSIVAPNNIEIVINDPQKCMNRCN